MSPQAEESSVGTALALRQDEPGVVSEARESLHAWSAGGTMRNAKAEREPGPDHILFDIQW